MCHNLQPVWIFSTQDGNFWVLAIEQQVFARDAAALSAALSQAKPPLDSNTELVRLAQDLLG
jgi:hypothetical protein